MRTQARSLLGLHLLLALYSVTNIFSKLASEQDFLSWQFVLYYGCVLLILAIYAVGWQQAIKRMPLTTAYANKAVTVVWGIVFGVLIFGETITVGKLAGAALIVAGVVWFGIEDARCQAELESQMRADLASGLTDANAILHEPERRTSGRTRERQRHRVRPDAGSEACGGRIRAQFRSRHTAARRAGRTAHRRVVAPVCRRGLSEHRIRPSQRRTIRRR